MKIKLHRKEQWDLDCWPWLCVHVERINARGNQECRRVFCVWSRGIQIGSWLRTLDQVTGADVEPTQTETPAAESTDAR